MLSSWASLVVQLVKYLPAMQETPFSSWVRNICWRRDRLPTPIFLGFPGGSAGKESAYSVGDLASTPGLGRSPWRREWLSIPLFWPGEFHGLYINRVTKSWTRLSDFHLGSPRGDRCSLRVASLDRLTEGIPTEPRSFSFPLWEVQTQETLAHRRSPWQCGKGAPGRGEDGEGSPQAPSSCLLSFVH